MLGNFSATTIANLADSVSLSVTQLCHQRRKQLHCSDWLEGRSLSPSKP